jgi:hypothetical protein
MFVGFEVLKGVVMKNFIFRNQDEATPGFLLGFFFDLEDGGDIFL